MEMKFIVPHSLRVKVIVFNAAVFSTRNRKTLQTLLHEEIVYGHSSGLCESKDEVLNRLAQPAHVVYTPLEIINVNAKIFGEAAVLRQRVTGIVHKNGIEKPLNMEIILVWVMSFENWQLIDRQAVNLNVN